MASKAKKAVTATIKLVINAGQAKPAPPVGPALGQAGLNIMSFCKDFNAKTADKKVCPSQGSVSPNPCGIMHGKHSCVVYCLLQPDIPVPVVITAYSDKSFTYVGALLPSTSYVSCFMSTCSWCKASLLSLRHSAKLLLAIDASSRIL